jgi:hypothetical protein
VAPLLELVTLMGVTVERHSMEMLLEERVDSEILHQEGAVEEEQDPSSDLVAVGVKQQLMVLQVEELLVEDKVILTLKPTLAVLDLLMQELPQKLQGVWHTVILNLYL